MFILCPNRYYFPSHIFSFPNHAPQGIWILKQTSSFSLVRNIIRKHWQQRRQLSNSLHPSGPNKTEIWQYLVEGKTWVRYTYGLRGLSLGGFGVGFLCVCVWLLGFFCVCVSVASAAAQLNCINISKKQPAPWRRSSQPCLAGCSSTRSLCDRGVSVLIQLEGKNCFHQRFFLTKCQKRARRYISCLLVLTLRLLLYKMWDLPCLTINLFPPHPGLIWMVFNNKPWLVFRSYNSLTEHHLFLLFLQIGIYLCSKLTWQTWPLFIMAKYFFVAMLTCVGNIAFRPR